MVSDFRFRGIFNPDALGNAGIILSEGMGTPKPDSCAYPVSHSSGSRFFYSEQIQDSFYPISDYLRRSIPGDEKKRAKRFEKMEMVDRADALAIAVYPDLSEIAEYS